MNPLKNIISALKSRDKAIKDAVKDALDKQDREHMKAIASQKANAIIGMNDLEKRLNEHYRTVIHDLNVRRKKELERITLQHRTNEKKLSADNDKLRADIKLCQNFIRSFYPEKDNFHNLAIVYQSKFTNAINGLHNILKRIETEINTDFQDVSKNFEGIECSSRRLDKMQSEADVILRIEVDER